MSYSAVINGLKVILPLLALGLLATLFLLGREVRQEAQLPFLDELRERVAGREGMSSSVYTGSNDAGDAVRVQAQTMRTDPDDSTQTLATDLRARINYSDGTELLIESDNGRYSDAGDTLVLLGNVAVQNSDGYTIRTEELHADMASGVAESPGPVDADGPAGQITAGAMTIKRATKDGDKVHLVFTNGVKLIYQRETETE